MPSTHKLGKINAYNGRGKITHSLFNVVPLVLTNFCATLQ